MNRQGARLLACCLDAPGDPAPRLVYADWLDEQRWGGPHAAFVRGWSDPRRAAGWGKTVFGRAVFDPPTSSAPLRPMPPSYAFGNRLWLDHAPAEVGFRPRLAGLWTARLAAALVGPAPPPGDRQPWKWKVRAGPEGGLVPMGYTGACPDPARAMRRALRALLVCRRRGCVCGRLSAAAPGPAAASR